ncbi:MAG: [FeFe] hydrogenase H-cluster radical SAM maturase HydE, partial [Lachnospiraceae bacterium]|nr:[FeFe] hydrogenase H-cluster radical SAM maturase HydE [Lachnospiraceae bacterium]
MQTVHELIDKLNKEHALKKEEWVFLLGHRTEEDAEYLFSCARKQQQKYFGNCVYTRGLIEFTNICRNDCYYCGIRKSNPNAERYRLTTEQILSCAKSGYELGFRTFVLQGGEDLAYKDEDIVCLVRTIKEAYPDCAVTLSIGEKSYESYQKYFDAGADRYLLRHETADEVHYRKLHPAELSLEHRKQCLYDLKEIGYQVGCGFMVGSPGQTYETLAEDMLFITKLQPQMVGIGP